MYVSYLIQIPSHYGYFMPYWLPCPEDEIGWTCSESELFVGTLEELLG